MRPVRVGLAYDACLLDNPPAWRRAVRLDVLVFPELLDGGYAALEAGRGRHDLHDDFIEGFRRLTRRRRITCIAGSVLLNDPIGNRHNTSLVLRAGRVFHRYSKIHLFRPSGDNRFFKPGESYRPFTLRVPGGSLRAGLILCYDLRFPELARSLALRGIQILFVPARWPKIRDAAWRTLLRARAIENQIFVVGCNARGREGGHSYVFDPAGREQFSSRRQKRSAIDVVAVDMGKVSAARAHHRNLAEARLLRRLQFPARLTGKRARGRRLRESAGG